MKIYHALPPAGDAAYRAVRSARPLVVAIGFFDGFHRGHRAIVRELLRLRRPGELAAIVTFREHPAAFLRPGHVPPLIMTLEERINSFAGADIDEAFVLPFDASIATLAPDAFLDETLVARIGARAMVVGANFRFGSGRSGDVEYAQAHLRRRGLDFVAVPNELDEGERVSSTRVRNAIASADFATADRLLGVAYSVRGCVAFGFGRGHDLGFPTANVVVAPGKILPPDGVYSIVGRLDGRDYRGLVSIGTNPTFDGRTRTVEAWLQDFQDTIYGEELALRRFRFIREQRKFASVEELLDQMRNDATHVRFPSFLPT